VVRTVFEGRRRISLAVRLGDEAARTLDALGETNVRGASSAARGRLPEVKRRG